MMLQPILWQKILTGDLYLPDAIVLCISVADDMSGITFVTLPYVKREQASENCWVGQEHLITLNGNKIITSLLSKQVNKYKNKVGRHSTVTDLPLFTVLIVLSTSVTSCCFKFRCKSVKSWLHQNQLQNSILTSARPAFHPLISGTVAIGKVGFVSSVFCGC